MGKERLGDFMDRIDRSGMDKDIYNDIGELKGGMKAIQSDVKDMMESSRDNFEKLYDQNRNTIKQISAQEANITATSKELKEHKDAHNRLWHIIVAVVAVVTLTVNALAITFTGKTVFR